MKPSSSDCMGVRGDIHMETFLKDTVDTEAFLSLLSFVEALGHSSPLPMYMGNNFSITASTTGPMFLPYPGGIKVGAVFKIPPAASRSLAFLEAYPNPEKSAIYHALSWFSF